MKAFIKPLASYYSRHAAAIFDGLAGFICLWSFGLSIVESTINQDPHHWGLMYAPALELKQGLIACKDVLIYYGVLTSWIQSIGLSIFGENFRSIGITTGLFYAFSLLLLYQIFKSFLSRHSAFFSLLIVFLLHAYIIFPWSNYFAYTFALLAVVAIVKLGSVKKYLLAGFCVGLAILARYSAVQAVLPPFILFFGYQYIAHRKSNRYLFKQCILFSIGLFIPLITFLTYLLVNQGLDNFILHNLLTVKAMGGRFQDSGIENFLSNLFLAKPFLRERDSRSMFFTFLFILDLMIFLLMLIQAIYHRRRLLVPNPLIGRREEIVTLVSLVSLFGYLNGLNLYETFRVANGASIGVGLIFYCLESWSIFQYGRRFLAWLAIIVLSAFCIHWSNTLIFSATNNTSVSLPWRFLSPHVEMVKVTDIKVLEGKFITREADEYYRSIQQVIASFDPTWPIINYTPNTIAPFVDVGRPRLQKSPAFFPAVQAGLTDEVASIEQAIAAKKAILLTLPEGLTPTGYPVFEPPPGYRVVLDVGAIVIFAPDGT